MQVFFELSAGAKLEPEVTDFTLPSCASPDCKFLADSHDRHEGFCCGRCRLSPGTGHGKQCQERKAKARTSHSATSAAPQATPDPLTLEVVAELREELHEEAIWRHRFAQEEQRLA